MEEAKLKMVANCSLPANELSIEELEAIIAARLELERLNNKK